MSALPDPSTAPQNAPEPITLQPNTHAPRTSRWTLWLTLGLFAAAGGTAWLLRPQPKSRSAAASLTHTVKAIRGALDQRLRVSGSISAKIYASVAAPMMAGVEADRGLVLLYLPPNGSMVREGQMIAQIDGQSVKDHVDDLDAQVAQMALDLRRLGAQQQAATESARQRVRAAQAALDKARQEMRALEVKTSIDRQRLQLALEEAQVTYEQQKQELQLLAERQESERRIAELDNQRQTRHRDRHRRDLDHFTIRAPMGGQVVLRTINRRGQQFQVQVGDELAPAQPFLRVVDLSQMQMDATINQTESEHVRIGQPAMVHFDAYPDLVVRGRVEAVGSMATGTGRGSNNYIRRIPVRIQIDDRDPRVIPDLTASADVVVAEQGEGLILPREAVHEEGGKSVVYVKQGDAVEAREVEVGGSSNTQVTVRSGIQAGEEVVVQPDGIR